MARVKACEVCAHRNPPQEVFCEACGASLADVPISAADPAGAPGLSDSGPETAATFREPAAVAARLTFDWGEVVVGDGLRVGRDPGFSSLADRISGLPTVSRRHAEVFVEAGDLFVRHLGETNPTYVNGRPLAPGERARLQAGDEVGFSLALRAVVGGG